MRRCITAVLVALVFGAPVAAPAAAQDPARDSVRARDARGATAYADAEAREMVRLARERRTLLDRRIRSYGATAVERMSIGLDAGILEKLLYRRETASRIDWTHDTVRVHVLGAREVVPAGKAAAQVPVGLEGSMPSIAFDPVDSEMLLRFDSTVIRHPLAAGSEAHYMFARGDSTVVALPDGRAVRLRELRITPRRRDRDLISGSFWLDRDTHAVVQAYFRLARAVSSEDDGDGVPFLGPVRAELDFVAVEYGLWELRWWMPRMVAARGVVQAGRFRLPIEFERRYSDYVITGDTLAPAPAPGEAPVIDERPCRPRTSFVVNIQSGNVPDSVVDERADSAVARRGRARAAARDSLRAARAAGEVPADSTALCDREFLVTQAPAAELLNNELLPGSIYGDGAVVRASELDDIARRVRALPGAPWSWLGPSLLLPWEGAGLLRYNRVEGAALGVRSVLDLGAVTADAELRLATASMEPYGAIGLTRRTQRLEMRAAAYRRVDIVDVGTQPFSFGSSLAALVIGRDDNDYFRTTGAELLLRPADARRQWYDVRLHAESQRTVERETDFSIRNLLDDEHVFRPNRAADRADQFGATVRLRTSGGLDPAAFRWGTELELLGEGGDFEFVRPSLVVRASTPLGPVMLGAEGAAGTTFGDAPAQRSWQLGGAATLRGYPGGVRLGESYWRGRVEAGIGLPLVRLALFADAGAAGPRRELFDLRPLRSIGAGIGLLDGLLRIDAARALDAPRDWRLHMQVNGIL